MTGRETLEQVVEMLEAVSEGDPQRSFAKALAQFTKDYLHEAALPLFPPQQP